MPRPPRIDFPDAVYHVTSRGNGRAKIFHSDDDRGQFLAQLAHHLHLCAVDLYAFVLMDNHFHLLCRTPRANLSRFTQRPKIGVRPELCTFRNKIGTRSGSDRNYALSGLKVDGGWLAGKCTPC